MSKTTLVTLLRPKSHSIHPADLHILLNTLAASSSLRAPGSESWLPICLPKFNAKGFVYAFISYFARSPEEGGTQVEQQEEMQLGVVLVTTDREAFFAMKAWKDAIAQVPFHLSSTTVTVLTRTLAETVPTVFQQQQQYRQELAVLPARSGPRPLPHIGASGPRSPSFYIQVPAPRTALRAVFLAVLSLRRRTPEYAGAHAARHAVPDGARGAALAFGQLWRRDAEVDLRGQQGRGCPWNRKARLFDSRNQADRARWNR